MRFLLLEPFYGGSHKAVADGIVGRTSHDMDLYALAARFWKWRMRGAGLELARRVKSFEGCDGIVCTSMLSLPDLLALVPGPRPPVAVYFHENQLTYPLSPGEVLDYQYPLINLATGLAADKVLFNSRTHMEGFLESLPEFIRVMPDYRPRWAIRNIAAKSSVLYPGCDFPAGDPRLAAWPDGPPLVVWNHRWEHDKNPQAFFDALFELADRGVDFEVALLGERFPKAPPVFDVAKERLGGRIVCPGYVEDRSGYEGWLARGAVAVSTSNQENFGISAVEAVRRGCLPLFPNRLSYPEILPHRFHKEHLYDGQKDLVDKLAGLLAGYRDMTKRRLDLSRAMGRFSWDVMAPEWDAVLEGLAGRRKAPSSVPGDAATSGPGSRSPKEA
ncbi:MAG: DUF3524 domain-containing protein [Desulfatibacillaceae bacterium]